MLKWETLFRFSAFLIAFLILPQIAMAHEINVNRGTNLLQLNKIEMMSYAALLLGLLSVAAIILRPKMSDSSKKTFFVLMAIVIIAVTSYLDFFTVYTNAVSVTHGPVHWHAHVSFMICGKEYQLAHKDISVDKPMHTHGDELIHVETTPLSWDDVILHRFFEYIGGEFTDTSLSFPSDEGIVSVKNGDLCYAKLGTLKMFVNGRPEPKMGEYVISPVEAGDSMDKILIVFD